MRDRRESGRAASTRTISCRRRCWRSRTARRFVYCMMALSIPTHVIKYADDVAPPADGARRLSLQSSERRARHDLGAQRGPHPAHRKGAALRVRAAFRTQLITCRRADCCGRTTACTTRRPTATARMWLSTGGRRPPACNACARLRCSSSSSTRGPRSTGKSGRKTTASYATWYVHDLRPMIILPIDLIFSADPLPRAVWPGADGGGAAHALSPPLSLIFFYFSLSYKKIKIPKKF